MTEREKAEKFAEQAPPLREGELEAINALFPAYLFRRRKTGEVWTTCCHEHITVDTISANGDMRRAMWEPHQREPMNRWNETPKPSMKCPCCGKPVIVKELRYTGRRENLSSYRRAVVLRWHEGALWARAYDCSKHYTAGYDLAGEPVCKLVGVYRFRPGLVEETTRSWYGNYPFTSIVTQEGPLTKGKWNIHSPFAANAYYGIGYDIIGLDEVLESPMRYCFQKDNDMFYGRMLEFLTACCFYPRQIEMLFKAGMDDVVQDLVERGVKHAAVIDWNNENPTRIFGLNRQELKTFLGTNRDIEILELHKRLKGRISITVCAEWMGMGLDIRKTFQAAKKWGLAPERLIRYLVGYVGCARYGGLTGLREALRIWEDYVTAAEATGYPLHRENVLLPKNLGAAHDEAAKKHNAILQRQRAQADEQWRQKQEQWRQEEQARKAAANAAYEERREELELKYGFEMDGLLIRAPISGAEVLDEGRILKHCVGGYADRHVQGKTTILFMRRAAKPNEPWLTIEMNKKKLVQIHGYRNEGIHTKEGRFAPDPREVYREFLDIWLDWLKKGSKRDKQGRPKLPRKKKAAA